MINFFSQRSNTHIKNEQYVPSDFYQPSEEDCPKQTIQKKQSREFQMFQQDNISTKNLTTIHQKISITFLFIIFVSILAFMNYDSWTILPKKPVKEETQNAKEAPQKQTLIDASPIIMKAPSPTFHLKSHQNIHRKNEDAEMLKLEKPTKKEAQQDEKTMKQALKISELKENVENNHFLSEESQDQKEVKDSTVKEIKIAQKVEKKTEGKKVEENQKKSSREK